MADAEDNCHMGQMICVKRPVVDKNLVVSNTDADNPDPRPQAPPTRNGCFSRRQQHQQHVGAPIFIYMRSAHDMRALLMSLAQVCYIIMIDYYATS